MRFVLTRLLPLAVLAYTALCALVFFVQRRLLYFPGPPPQTTPGTIGLAWEAVELRTEDGERLHAWLVEPRHGEPRGVVLLCHGNAGSIEHRLHLARAFAERGLATLLFDYRGYGASSGTPSEAGLYRDGAAALAWTRQRFGERVVLWGESLGGGVAVELAAGGAGVAGVVLEKTFTAAVDLAASIYPWLPVRLLMRDRFDNAAKLERITAPLLVVHSREDHLVPFAHAERLFARAREPKELVPTSGGHNDFGFLDDAPAAARVFAFLERTLP